MIQKKNLQQRQLELQALIATPVGREELQKLASRYAAFWRPRFEASFVETIDSTDSAMIGDTLFPIILKLCQIVG